MCARDGVIPCHESTCVHHDIFKVTAGWRTTNFTVYLICILKHYKNHCEDQFREENWQRMFNWHYFYYICFLTLTHSQIIFIYCIYIHGYFKGKSIHFDTYTCTCSYLYKQVKSIMHSNCFSKYFYQLKMFWIS